MGTAIADCDDIVVVEGNACVVDEAVASRGAFRRGVQVRS